MHFSYVINCLIKKLVFSISQDEYQNLKSKRYMQNSGLSSDYLNITQGVWQGSIVGPTPFSIYTVLVKKLDVHM